MEVDKSKPNDSDRIRNKRVGIASDRISAGPEKHWQRIHLKNIVLEI